MNKLKTRIYNKLKKDNGKYRFGEICQLFSGEKLSDIYEAMSELIDEKKIAGSGIPNMYDVVG